MSEQRGLLLVAQIGRPHGVKGEVRVKCFTADPLALADYSPLTGEDGRRLAVVSLRPDKGDMVVARFQGVGDRSAAEALGGLGLYVPREALPEAEEDEFYHADLIGLEARSPSGERLGRVQAIHDFGAGDVLEVKPPQGASFLLAFTRENVPEIDLSSRFLILDLPEEVEVREEGAGSEEETP
ncbi:ribosome maturation factor RimM [Afifella sp. IM 167]|uniref:ribosome maturation factor RimM n=1 Tax=Afifella sp. IM 167 TaxID=2033586 RepID=UPI001CCB52CD|nr:ribosome maturation factor RimM [Afifella sp. IM 167]MBZ8132807.1 16S rRNA processing protein RimM [Afifella sp. IM 167]